MKIRAALGEAGWVLTAVSKLYALAAEPPFAEDSAAETESAGFTDSSQTAKSETFPSSGGPEKNNFSVSPKKPHDKSVGPWLYAGGAVLAALAAAVYFSRNKKQEREK